MSERKSRSTPANSSRGGTPLEGRLGRHAVTGRLGVGGMGVVLRVLDPALEREMAAKVVKREAAAPSLEKFVREARITGRLEHPGIPPVHELGQTGRSSSHRASPAPTSTGGRSAWSSAASTRRSPTSTGRSSCARDDAGALINRGSSYEEKGDPERALADYDRAIEIAPRYWLGWANHGVLLRRMGRTAEAIEALEKAHRFAPNSVKDRLARDIARLRGG